MAGVNSVSRLYRAAGPGVGPALYAARSVRARRRMSGSSERGVAAGHAAAAHVGMAVIFLSGRSLCVLAAVNGVPAIHVAWP